MAERTVTGSITRLDGSPWVGVPVTFTLNTGSYQLGRLYPRQNVTVKTDKQGFFTAQLWINETGLTPSVYVCTIQQDTFEFTLPPGDNAIDITTLRTLGVQPSPSQIPKRLDQRQTFVPTTGQTEFSLTRVPINPHLSKVWLNGVKATYVKDYLIDNALLKWFSIRLEDTDFLEILYYLES